ncbi:Xaa-Pro peptidase family protein [Parabacteroides sp. OttesenSCG-928-G07]|nr:Xaa-Pro peptidase family protein [Parabacteroides sp. OttesenSCG-928-G21]MDL2277699.1 Xaa-Pro peptidase family protein [Parabacteroides sp. OttesenSCG-928-G07]
MIAEELYDDLQIRWGKLQEYMAQTATGGCLLSADVNLYYMTGKVYNGYLYISQIGEPWFFVKRPEGLEGDGVIYIRKPEDFPSLFAEYGISMPKKILMEADELSHTDYMRLHAAFGRPDVGNATAAMRELRSVKTPWEIEQFRISAEKHALTYSEIPECYQPGMTDLDFQAEIERRMRKNGSMGLFRTFGANMDIHMGSILAGDNAEHPSPFDFALGGAGINDSLPIGANGTELKEGMAVMVDMAGNYTPYITDMTRVYSIGELPDIAYRAHKVALAIQEEIELMAQPGVLCSELYNRALDIAEEEGLGEYFMGTKQQAKFVGHGIGLQINELPILTPRSWEKLKPGMVFALEPKFVIPGVGAVGIENSYLVTETGLEKLTIFEEDIIRLD